MIRIEAVRKRFGRFVALDGVDLEVEAGRAVALWGPNGAGKTTLLRCVLGLISFRGRVLVDGIDVRRHGKSARRRLGYIPQESILPADLRVSEAMALFGGLRRAERGSAGELLRLVELDHARRKRVGDLSGGMRQRLSLALALLGDPPLLVLDEPTSNLDAAGRRAFLDLLLRLKSGGKTILFTSHRPEEVSHVADRIVTLENGCVVGSEAVGHPARGGAPVREGRAGLVWFGVSSDDAERLRDAAEGIDLIEGRQSDDCSVTMAGNGTACASRPSRLVVVQEARA